MVKILNVVCGLFLVSLLLSCSNEKKELAHNSIDTKKIEYEDASKVPVGKLGVFIVIDSLGVFENNSDQFTLSPVANISKNLIEENEKNELENYIEERAKNILIDQKKNFEFIKLEQSIQANDFFRLDFDATKYANVFNSLPFDDFLIIAIRSGIGLDDNKNLEGKTNIYLSIIDKRSLKSKYYETVTGSKYLEQKDFANSLDYQKNLIKQSLEHTIEIIDSKY